MEKTLARLLSPRTMGGKAILQTPGSSCRAQVSKDAVPLAVYFTLLSLTVSNQRGEAGKEV